ncbi:MAG: DoxX family protein [Rhodospirillaceae bacterium]
MTFLTPMTGFLHSAMRIVSGLLFLQHGTTKFLSFPATKYSGIDPFFMAGAAGMIELLGGARSVVGLFTRPAAFVMSGTMAAAYFMAHFPQGFFPTLNGGKLAALYCFVFLYIAPAGDGPLSLDRMMGRS